MSEQATSGTNDVTKCLSDEAWLIQQGKFRGLFNGQDVRFDAKHNRIIVNGQHAADYVVTLDNRAWFRPLEADTWTETPANDELAYRAINCLDGFVDGWKVSIG
jgi:hypothetical protein